MGGSPHFCNMPVISGYMGTLDMPLTVMHWNDIDKTDLLFVVSLD